ncbi:hypothetical protein HDV00_003635 [Rhizophlyctis rosea]|nr:hypothetical protein HDV00_003635 [Rhizophlyctis rosea]
MRLTLPFLISFLGLVNASFIWNRPAVGGTQLTYTVGVSNYANWTYSTQGEPSTFQTVPDPSALANVYLEQYTDPNNPNTGTQAASLGSASLGSGSITFTIPTTVAVNSSYSYAFQFIVGTNNPIYSPKILLATPSPSPSPTGTTGTGTGGGAVSLGVERSFVAVVVVAVVGLVMAVL